jgi:hypothetical protein
LSASRHSVATQTFQANPEPFMSWDIGVVF